MDGKDKVGLLLIGSLCILLNGCAGIGYPPDDCNSLGGNISVFYMEAPFFTEPTTNLFFENQYFFVDENPDSTSAHVYLCNLISGSLEKLPISDPTNSFSVGRTGIILYSKGSKLLGYDFTTQSSFEIISDGETYSPEWNQSSNLFAVRRYDSTLSSSLAIYDSNYNLVDSEPLDNYSNGVWISDTCFIFEGGRDGYGFYAYSTNTASTVKLRHISVENSSDIILDLEVSIGIEDKFYWCDGAGIFMTNIKSMEDSLVYRSCTSSKVVSFEIIEQGNILLQVVDWTTEGSTNLSVTETSRIFLYNPHTGVESVLQD